MIWRIKSYGTLDMTTDYFAFIEDADNPNVQPPVELDVVQVGEAAPAEAGMTRKEDYLVITVIPKGANKQAKIDALEMAFDSLKGTSQQLVALDNNNAEWYVLGRVSNHAMKAMMSKITLQVADSVWRSTTEESETWNITASGQTHDVTVGGTVEALPIFELTTEVAKTGGFSYRDWIRLYNPNSAAVLNEMVDITNGGLDTAALVLAGKMRSDGNDVRVYDGGQEVDRILVGMDGANTKIFAGPFNFQPKIEMAISVAISNVGDVTAIYVKKTADNIKLLTRLPNQRGIMEVNNERFIYTGRDVKKLRIDIAERSVRKSTAGSHSIGDMVKWIEHDPWLYYGNSTMEAPTMDPNREPAYDVATSTNASRVYTSFGDKAGLRPGVWKMAVLKRSGTESTVYTGNHGDDTADPITDMGMMIKSYIKSGKPAAENATLECRLSHPGLITSVIVPAGEKRRTTATWAKTAALQKSKDGKSYANQFNETTPAGTAYVSITNTALQNLGAGYGHIRFLLEGSVGAVLDAEIDLQIGGLTVVITNPITAALQGEESNYDLDCEIQNETTGQSLFLKWTMATPSDTLTIDSEERTIIHSDGSNAYRAKRLDVPRIEWLPFKPNAVNRLKFIDVGTQGVRLVIRRTNRRKR